jgi:hypothetical protein
MAMGVAYGYLLFGRPIVDRLYWIVFGLTIFGNAWIGATDPHLLAYAWVGPPLDPWGHRHLDERGFFEHLKMVVPIALGFFFCAPLLRRTYGTEVGASTATSSQLGGMPRILIIVIGLLVSPAPFAVAALTLNAIGDPVTMIPLPRMSEPPPRCVKAGCQKLATRYPQLLEESLTRLLRGGEEKVVFCDEHTEHYARIFWYQIPPLGSAYAVGGVFVLAFIAHNRTATRRQL